MKSFKMGTISEIHNVNKKIKEYEEKLDKYDSKLTKQRPLSQLRLSKKKTSKLHFVTLFEGCYNTILQPKISDD